jgi:hypothetical protein
MAGAPEAGIVSDTRDDIVRDLATVHCPSCRAGVVEADIEPCAACNEAMCLSCHRDHVCGDEDERR